MPRRFTRRPDVIDRLHRVFFPIFRHCYRISYSIQSIPPIVAPGSNVSCNSWYSAQFPVRWAPRNFHSAIPNTVRPGATCLSWLYYYLRLSSLTFPFFFFSFYVPILSSTVLPLFKAASFMQWMDQGCGSLYDDCLLWTRGWSGWSGTPVTCVVRPSIYLILYNCHSSLSLLN